MFSAGDGYNADSQARLQLLFLCGYETILFRLKPAAGSKHHVISNTTLHSPFYNAQYIRSRTRTVCPVGTVCVHLVKLVEFFVILKFHKYFENVEIKHHPMGPVGLPWMKELTYCTWD